MGWRGTLRAIEAAAKRAQRESQRRHKQLERIARQEAKLEAKERAACEAEVYENKIERLLSVYIEASEDWDWNAVFNTPPIVPPERFARREQAALQALGAYVPGEVSQNDIQHLGRWRTLVLPNILWRGYNPLVSPV